MNDKVPSQAVILAGGQGTRLRPFTLNQPKPLIPIGGQPFLGYLIRQLAEQGFTHILILLGYLSEKIVEYIDSNTPYGTRISYSITGVEDETGKRLKQVAAELDDYFLLMYCDNYWPMNIQSMWRHFKSIPDAKAQITVYDNKDNFTADNLIIDKNSKVQLYDKKRSTPGLKGVDIGYAIISRDIVFNLPQDNINFEKAVYPSLALSGHLAAYITGHRYYSIGNLDRIPITEKFFKQKPAILLDRDGVLNVKPAKSCYVTSPDEFKWLPGSIEAVKSLNQAGYLVIIITNQAGIARGQLAIEELNKIHGLMKKDLADRGAIVDAIYYCPHGWDEDCECRKPKPGMILNAQKDFHIDLSRSTFIGDDQRDMEAGVKAGCKTILLSQGETLLDIIHNPKHNLLHQ